MYNFAVDLEKIETVASELTKSAAEVEGYVNNIIDSITGLNESWSGTSYDTFLAKCKEFYPSMQMLPVMLKAFSKILNETVSPAENTLDETIKTAFGNV